MQKLQTESDKYRMNVIQGKQLLCYYPHGVVRRDSFRIAIPQYLVDRTIRWYHLILGHCGSKRLYDTISNTFYFPNLKRRCSQFRCRRCQLNKSSGRGYGYLPPRDARMLPWEEVHVDLIGPWVFEFSNKRKVEFNALTCIDPVTNLVEIIPIRNKTSHHVAQQFENVWLSRYPRPTKCVFDNGSEFVGSPFLTMLEKHGITERPTTVKNPQANSLCERMHQTVANVLRTTIPLDPPQNREQAQQLVENAIATTVYATRVSVSQSLGTSPGNLAFRRDMLMDIQLTADFLTIRDKRQQLIDANLQKHNGKRRDFDYRVGMNVLMKHHNPSKLNPRHHGPYRVVQVYTNGTVDIRRTPTIIERVNIRRLIPFHDPTLPPPTHTVVQDVETAPGGPFE